MHYLSWCYFCLHVNNSHLNFLLLLPPCVLCLTFATALYSSLLFSFLFFFPFPFPYPDACVHVIESKPGAGSRPGIQQPNKLSAHYQARPAGKKLCVCIIMCTSLCDCSNTRLPLPLITLISACILMHSSCHLE